jgi:immunoglobulin-like protein involved in spore germination
MKRLLLVIILTTSSCGGSVSPTPTPFRTPSATPTIAASQTNTPLPTSLTSAKGFITVARPLTGTRITSPLVISGDASVFEATLQWRIVDGGGREYAKGIATASAGAPARGTFSVTATYTGPATDTSGFVEVYETSPRDGSIDDIVRVPVIIGR